MTPRSAKEAPCAGTSLAARAKEGPIRQIVRGEADVERRYLVITPGTPDQHGAVVQIQAN
jgi:hypothetical protein